MSHPSTRPRGVLPVLAAYMSFGYFWGTWSVVFLEFVGAHHFPYSRMSLYLMSLTIASMATMILLTPRIAHLLPSVSLPLALVLYGAGIVAMPYVNDAWLIAAFAVTGMGTGLIDVLVNQVGHGLEASSRRSVLQPVHAGYSMGAVFGALGAALILTGGGSFRTAVQIAALLQVPSFFLCLTSPAFRGREPGERSEERMSLSAFRGNPALLATALIVLSAFFIEGSLDVWAVTYLRATLGAGILAGAIGFAAFGVSTAVGRTFAAKILFGMGYRRTILFSGIGSVLAGALAIVAPNEWIASLAYLILGFCLASAGPAAFGSIQGEGTEVGVAIAAVTTIGYAGFVVGPPVMGWLADVAGIRSTMVIITLATGGILLGGFLSRTAVPERPAAGD
ncbi:MAG: MFS transporter [Planctomycetaceae bacterium]